ncbi:chaperonin 10-like protein [Lipomyces tetrasporus]|uniref:Chaperonin 10-like protein n=1 Tax=Lipomyces tetrasporus TaxID=54092 RepID=A0AAD7QVN5_9ASCO|nr:chaperonin 10-like protein [Lipomyces tetrasporus]KAJ8102320.1 chaperonin 10-like protein [Lipomyces tetrasporus]
MKALRYYGPHDVRLDNDVKVPEITGPNDVLICPQWCGICGTDLHEFLDGPIFCPVKPHPLTHETVPVVMGHEFSGIVKAVGSSVSSVKPGDHVCVEATIRCNTGCPQCREGRTNCCSDGGFFGLSGWGGGLSELVIVPSEQVFKLPDDLPLEAGALVEPLSVAWHAVRLSGFKAGQTALVLGSGPIGIATILALQAHDAAKIIVSEPAEIRRKQSAQFGVHALLNPQVDDVVAKTREMTCGEGVDVSYDCSGVQATFTTGLHAVKSGGIAFNIAIWGKPCSYHPNECLLMEKKIMGSIGYVGQDFADVIKAFEQGKIRNFEKMITAKLPIAETVSGGFSRLIHHKDEHIKIICTPHPELLQ